MFSDSMTQRIDYKEFNRNTPNHQTFFNSFRGATSKSLQHYVEPTLDDIKPEVSIIHCGTNDIAPHPHTSILSDIEIVEEIRNIGLKCK